MAERAVARRYARALLEIAEEADAVDVLADDIDKALGAFRSHDGQLYGVLSNPIFTAAERKGVLEQVLPKVGLQPMTANLLRLLLDKGRFALLPDITHVYRAYADEKAGRARVIVQTAEPLTGPLEGEVRAALQKVTGKTVILETQVDPSLIGGMIARVGDMVYDASVRTRLQDIKARLLSTRQPAEA